MNHLEDAFDRSDDRHLFFIVKLYAIWIPPITQIQITSVIHYQVIGGEEQGIPVAIGHVTPEGPAEGLLQIYDEIRSVNGKILFTSYQSYQMLSIIYHLTIGIIWKK
jgi:hypothetical protein